MQNITSNQKEYLWEGKTLGITITVDPVEGQGFNITGDDIVADSVSIERNWAQGDVIEIGCADTSELVFDLDNEQGQWNHVRWEGARLTVVLDVNGELLQAGIFTVDERPGKLTTMQIRALDDMARFNKAYDTDLLFPATLQQVLVDACAKCNVTLYTQTFDNGDYTVGEKPVGDGVTYHQVIAWVAQLAGCNAWIDQLSRLQLSWYGDNQSGDLEIGPDDRFDYQLSEDDIEITGVIYRPTAGEDDIDYLVGNDTYALIIEDNPLLQDGYEAVLSALHAKICGFRYRPYEFVVVGYPHLWPGDVITKLIDADGNELYSVITNHNYRLNGNSEIRAVGETETVRGYATGAPFTASQKRVLQSVAKVEAARQTTALEQATLHLNELMVNALGFYTTVVELETGAKIVYTHDKPLLKESEVIWTQTELGFAWTDEGWNDGDPNWQYGVMSDGSMIIKMLIATGIQAEWIDAIDLTAITSRFTELWAGNIEGAHLHMGEESGLPYFEMFDENGDNIFLLDKIGIHMNPLGQLRFPYPGAPSKYGLIQSLNNANRRILRLQAGEADTAGPRINLYRNDDSTYPGEIRFFGGDNAGAFHVKADGTTLFLRDVQLDGATVFNNDVIVSSTLYFPAGNASPGYINGTTVSDRDFLIIRTGTGGYSGFNLYGEDDASFPGQMWLQVGGNTVQRLYANMSVRFYGDVQIDGQMLGSSIVGSSQLRVATSSTSGTASSSDRDNIVLHRRAFFPNVYCFAWNASMGGFSSNNSDYIGRFSITGGTYSVRWEYMASTEPLKTVILVNTATGEITNCIMDGGGMDYLIDEYRQEYRRKMNENADLIMIEPTIEELAEVLAGATTELGDETEIVELLNIHDQQKIDAATVIEKLRYDNKLVAKEG